MGSGSEVEGGILEEDGDTADLRHAVSITITIVVVIIIIINNTIVIIIIITIFKAIHNIFICIINVVIIIDVIFLR